MPPKKTTVITIGKDNSNTREKDPIKRGKKRYNIDQLEAELGGVANHWGVYIITPYQNLDNTGRTVFKVGMSRGLKRRTDNYLTYFPSIMFHSFLTGFDEERTKEDIESDVKQIEKEVIEKIHNRDKRSRKLYFQQRVVASEWVYTKSSIIDEVCLEIAEEYDLQYKGYEDNFNETVKDDYEKNLPEAIFVGKILFS